MDLVFPEADRDVFPYFNGARIVYGDPVAIDNRYFTDLADEDLDALNEQFGSKAEAVQIEAESRTIQAVRAAFKLVPFDEETGEGATDGMAGTLWIRYQDWKDGLKKKAASGPSTPPPSADSPSPPGSPAATST